MEPIRKGTLSSGLAWQLIASRKSCLVGPDGEIHGQHLILTLGEDVQTCSDMELGELYVLAERIAIELAVGKTPGRYFIRRNGPGTVRRDWIHIHIVLPNEDIGPNANVDNPDFRLLRGIESQIVTT